MQCVAFRLKMIVTIRTRNVSCHLDSLKVRLLRYVELMCLAIQNDLTSELFQCACYKSEEQLFSKIYNTTATVHDNNFPALHFTASIFYRCSSTRITLSQTFIECERIDTKCSVRSTYLNFADCAQV